MKRLCFSIIAFFCLLPLCGAFMSLISNCIDLQTINKTGTYSISNDIDCSTITSFNSVPLFSGTLFGNNRIVQNLLINSSSTGPLGLFECLQNAAVQDIFFINVTVLGNASYSAGALAGNTSNTNITNCHLTSCQSVSNLIKGQSIAGGSFL